MSAFSVFLITSILFFLESIIFVKGLEKSSLSGLLVSDTSGLIKLSSEGSTGGGGQKSSQIGLGGGVSGKTGRKRPSLLLFFLTALLSAKSSNSAFLSANLNSRCCASPLAAPCNVEVLQIFSLMTQKR